MRSEYIFTSKFKKIKISNLIQTFILYGCFQTVSDQLVGRKSYAIDHFSDNN